MNRYGPTLSSEPYQSHEYAVMEEDVTGEYVKHNDCELLEIRIAGLEKELEEALYFNIDVVRCLSTVAWEHNHNVIADYMELAKGCIVTIEAKPFKAIKGSK